MKEIKKLTSANVDDITALSQFAFQYELSETELAAKKSELKRHKIWGWMQEEELAAKLHIIPLSCYINGKPFDMGGIASVATWPEYRRQGMIKNLLHHALKQMKASDQTVSFLHPFSVAFYRKYGWELAVTRKHYSIPIEKLKRTPDAQGYVRRIKKDVPLLQDIYTMYAKQFTGMLVRDEKWWEQRVLKDKSHIAIAYNEHHEEEGYIIYTVKENKFTVKEMVYTSLNGWKLLLQFIANHDSMAEEVSLIVPENDNLELLLDDPTFKQKSIPYFMARIVDVAAFFKNYSFRASNDPHTLFLHVEDSFLPENNGTYQLTSNGTETDVVYHPSTENKGGIHCSVQVLTSIFLGYKRPLELFQVGLLQGEVQEIEQLERLIPHQQSFMADFF